ncbi:MAG: response regulator [Chloroflexi bacterium]|nr:response regulator [Chloroflexota bacterium]
MITVYLVDERVLFREGIHYFLSREEGIELVGESASNQEALDFIVSHAPDVAILYNGHGQSRGTEITRLIKKEVPSVSVILIMDEENKEQTLSAAKSGASACITHDIDPSQLGAIVRDVVAGNKVITSEMLEAAIDARAMKRPSNKPVPAITQKVSQREIPETAGSFDEFKESIRESSIERSLGEPSLREARTGTVGPPSGTEDKVIKGPEAVVPSITEVWDDVGVRIMVEALLTGKLTEITPEIDLSVQDGFTYPEAEGIMKKSGKAMARILEALVTDGILVRRPFIKLLLSPDGSAQLLPEERCPHCLSSDIVAGRVIEHYACGYVGLETEFKAGHQYVCPKCRKELKQIGTDYRNLGLLFRCNTCHEISPAPLIEARSTRTGKVYKREELTEVWLYSYHLNERKAKWTDFQARQKARLVALLKRQGYEVEERARVAGKSGTIHTIDVLATRDDMILQHRVAMGIPWTEEPEIGIRELFDFESKCNDAGIHDKVVIAVTKLSREAQAFAEIHQIKVHQAEDLTQLLSGNKES